VSKIGWRGFVAALALLLTAGSFGALAIDRIGGTATCAAGRTASAGAADAGWSVARRWDEALLDAIRRALPNPPVHARNLFHTSLAMWDAWATYDPTASGDLFTKKHTAIDIAAARDQAGQSRLFGWIHIQADDFAGRIIGAQCGKDAWARAQRMYAGQAGG